MSMNVPFFKKNLAAFLVCLFLLSVAQAQVIESYSRGKAKQQEKTTVQIQSNGFDRGWAFRLDAGFGIVQNGGPVIGVNYGYRVSPYFYLGARVEYGIYNFADWGGYGHDFGFRYIAESRVNIPIKRSKGFGLFVGAEVGLYNGKDEGLYSIGQISFYEPQNYLYGFELGFNYRNWSLGGTLVAMPIYVETQYFSSGYVNKLYDNHLGLYFTIEYTLPMKRLLMK